jgi:hypothetical protein
MIGVERLVSIASPIIAGLLDRRRLDTTQQVIVYSTPLLLAAADPCGVVLGLECGRQRHNDTNDVLGVTSPANARNPVEKRASNDPQEGLPVRWWLHEIRCFCNVFNAHSYSESISI